MSRAILSVVAYDLTDTSGDIRVDAGGSVYVYETDGATLLGQAMYAGATGGAPIQNPLIANNAGVATAYADNSQDCVVKIGTVSYPMQFLVSQSNAPSLVTPLNLTQKAPGAIAAPAATLDSLYPLTDGTFAHRATGGAEKVFVDTSTAQTVAGPKTLTAPVINTPTITNGIATGATLANAVVSNVMSFPDGVVSAPSLVHTNDVPTGQWFPGAGQIAWSLAGWSEPTLVTAEAARLRAGAIETRIRDRGGVVFNLDAYAGGVAINVETSNAATLAALDAAWAAVNLRITANGGGTVQLGPGTYMQTLTTQVNGTIIRGAGKGATIIKRRDGSILQSTVNFFGLSNCAVMDLTVDGNRTNNLSLTTAISEISIDEAAGPTGGADNTIMNVEVRAFHEHAISCGGTRNAVINCHINGPTLASYTSWVAQPTTAGGGVYGIFTPGLTICTDILIHGNRVHGLRGPAIFVGGTRPIISANQVEDCHRADYGNLQGGGQIALAPTSTNHVADGNQVPLNAAVFGNTVGPLGSTAPSTTYAFGIELASVQRCACTGNVVHQVNAGISFDATAISVAISGGSIYNIINGGSGISPSVNASYFTVCGVAISNCAGSGIITTGTSDYFAVVGNVFNSNTVNWDRATGAALTGTHYESHGNVAFGGEVIPNRMTSPLSLGTTDTGASIRSLIALRSGGVNKTHIALDASDQFAILTANAATANLTMTDAGVATIRAGLAVTAGQTIIPVGLVGTPSIAFAGSTTGIYSSGAEILDFTNAGVNSLRLTAAGLLDFRIAAATVALGGGAAPTVGTIGGSGPASAAQNSWLKVLIGGTASYIPIWR